MTLSSQGQRNGKEKHWGLWLAILIMITVLEALCVILAANGILGAKINANGVSEFFGYVGGAGVATAMGLYLSRLGSNSGKHGFTTERIVIPLHHLFI